MNDCTTDLGGWILDISAASGSAGGDDGEVKYTATVDPDCLVLTPSFTNIGAGAGAGAGTP